MFRCDHVGVRVRDIIDSAGARPDHVVHTQHMVDCVRHIEIMPLNHSGDLVRKIQLPVESPSFRAVVVVQTVRRAPSRNL